jgi:predicted PurR-regulated permease PerM
VCAAIQKSASAAHSGSHAVDYFRHRCGVGDGIDYRAYPAKEAPQLQEQIPRFFDKFDQVISPLLAHYGFTIRLDSTGIKALLTEQMAGSGDVIGKAVLSSIRVGGTALLGLLANLLLIPIVLFYLLLDWHPLIHRIAHFIPRRWVHGANNAVNEVDDILAQYLRGQILVMIVLAAYYAIALSIARFDLALPVGIITGFWCLFLISATA